MLIMNIIKSIHWQIFIVCPDQSHGGITVASFKKNNNPSSFPLKQLSQLVLFTKCFLQVVLALLAVIGGFCISNPYVSRTWT